MNIITGDILFVNKGTLWGKVIGWFQGNPYHHVGILINAFDTIYVFEAIGTGMAFTPFKEYQNKVKTKGYKLCIKRHIDNPFEKLDESIVMNFCLPLTDRPYEFTNLIGYQAIRMLGLKLTGRNIWIGRSKKKSYKSFICSELVGVFYNSLIGMFKNNWYKLAPSDIFKHPKLETKYIL